MHRRQYRFDRFSDLARLPALPGQPRWRDLKFFRHRNSLALWRFRRVSEWLAATLEMSCRETGCGFESRALRSKKEQRRKFQVFDGSRAVDVLQPVDLSRSYWEEKSRRAWSAKRTPTVVGRSIVAAGAGLLVRTEIVSARPPEQPANNRGARP